MATSTVAPQLLTDFVPDVRNADFLTDPKSPFPDKYSIEREEIFLAEFIASDNRTREFHPLYDRYIELLDRKDQFDKMKSSYKSNLGADKMVQHKDIQGMKSLGALKDEGTDTMDLHTKEAYRMFIGRSADPELKIPPIIGGVRMGGVLKNLWYLTGKDNPFADWALVKYEQLMNDVKQRLESEIDSANASIQEMAKNGINLSILISSDIKKVELGFRSPYGFATATFIQRFDYYVRLMKTLNRKSLLTDDQVRDAIHEMCRLIRRVWEGTNKFDKWLSRDELKELARADYVEGASEDAAKRVQFASMMFGSIPVPIFTCAIQPKFSKRTKSLTPQENALLQSIGVKMAQSAGIEATSQVNAPTVGAAKADAPESGEVVPQDVEADKQMNGAISSGKKT